MHQVTCSACTNQQPPQHGGAIPDPVLVGSKWLLAFPRVPVTPGTPLHFFAMLLRERPQKGSTQHLQNRSTAFSFFFSCPSLALLRLLMLLLLLTSSNVHPSPGPIFPCSACAGNVTWQGKSVQCCTCFKWVHLRCSQFSLSKFRALDSSHSWSCPPFRNTVTPSSKSTNTYTSIVQSGPPLLMLHSRVTPISKPLIPHLPISHLLPLPLHHHPLLLAVLLHLLPPLLPLTLSGFFNGMLEVSEPGALNYFTFSRPILLTLSAFRNLILTHLSLSGFLDSLLCILIAPTPSLAFSLLMPRKPAAALSFSSGRDDPFLNFLPGLFLRLIPTLIM